MKSFVTLRIVAADCVAAEAAFKSAILVDNIISRAAVRGVVVLARDVSVTVTCSQSALVSASLGGHRLLQSADDPLLSLAITAIVDDTSLAAQVQNNYCGGYCSASHSCSE